MPSGWDVYYIIFLSAALALGIPAVLAAASFLFGGKKKSLPGQTRAPAPGRMGVAEPGTEASILGQRINTRIFLGTNVALLLIALVLMMIPCIVDVGGAGNQATARNSVVQTRALVAIVSVALFAAMGLIYAVRKQDLSWLKTYRAAAGEPEEDGES